VRMHAVHCAHRRRWRCVVMFMVSIPVLSAVWVMWLCLRGFVRCAGGLGGVAAPGAFAAGGARTAHGRCGAPGAFGTERSFVKVCVVVCVVCTAAAAVISPPVAMEAGAAVRVP